MTGEGATQLGSWTEALTTAIAYVDATGRVAAENAAFKQWFPSGTSLVERVPAIEHWPRDDGAEKPLRSQAIGAHGRAFSCELRWYAQGEGWIIEGVDRRRLAEKEAMIKTFSAMVDRNNRLLRYQKKAQSDLLDNMRQAVFAVNARLRVVEPVSRFAVELFGRDISRGELFDVLYRELEQDEWVRVESAFELVFGQGELQWMMCCEDFPARIELSGDGDEPTILRVSYAPIYEDGMVDKVLIVVEDITERERFEVRARLERERRVEMLHDVEMLAAHPKEVLTDFFYAAAAHLRCCQEPESPREDVLRALHTLKGDARTLGLRPLVDEAHRAESSVVEGGCAADAVGSLAGRLSSYNSLAARLFEVDDAMGTSQSRALDLALRAVDGAIARRASAELAEAARRLEVAVAPLDDVQEVYSVFAAEVLLPMTAGRFEVEEPAERAAARLYDAVARRFSPPPVANDVGPAAPQAPNEALTRMLVDRAESDAPVREALEKRAGYAETLELLAQLDPAFSPLCEELRARPALGAYADRASLMGAAALAVGARRRRRPTVAVDRDRLDALHAALAAGDDGAVVLAAQRMVEVPLRNVVAGLDSMVRDIAAQEGKEVRLEVDLVDVELPSGWVRALRDALIHLLRNGIDHGIEAPDARRAAGKPSAGTIAVGSHFKEGGLELVVQDDGGGIDRARLAAKVGGVATDAELLDAVFRAGLSTREVVTELSGRGVGLGVVRAELRRLGGDVSVSSQRGQGTTFRLFVPRGRAERAA